MEQIMDIKEFQKKLIETINEKTENAVIEAKEVIGNNGVKRHGLVMKGTTQYTNPVIYIDKEYERYSDEEEIDDIYDISQRIIQIYELSKNEDIGQEEMVKNINDWNWAKNKVMFTCKYRKEQRGVKGSSFNTIFRFKLYILHSTAKW